MHKASTATAYTKLADIKSFPDLGGAPEMLETTTLSDSMETYITGVQSQDALEFELNYTKALYKTLKALEGESENYAVWFGGTGSGDTFVPDGSAGKFKWTGQLSVWVTGGGVNEVVGMTVSISPSTEITPDED